MEKRSMLTWPEQQSSPRVLDAATAAAIIRTALQAGQRLVACLCAPWCGSCAGWRHAFEALAASALPSDCFVWVDIEECFDLVTEFDLDTLPVLLVQDSTGIQYLGVIEPRAETVSRLLRQNSAGDFADPGLWHFLQET